MDVILTKNSTTTEKKLWFMCKMQNASRRKEILFGIMSAITSEIMAYG